MQQKRKMDKLSVLTVQAPFFMIVVLHFVPSFRVGAIAVDRCRRWPSFCYEPLPPQYLRYIIASAGSCCSFSALNFHILSTSGGPLILSEVAARLCFLKFFSG